MESGAKDQGVPALDNQRLEYALGHQLRVRIAAALKERRMSQQELAAALDEPLPRIVYHHRVLEEAGALV